MKEIVSSASQKAAIEVFEANKIIKTADKFEVYEIPDTVTKFRGYALLLFKDKYDFVEDSVPDNTMFIPVIINNRKGYFIAKGVAQDYSQS